jgi:hypothetical protein
MTNERTSRRTGLAIGLSAGLVGGTIAGLAFGVPGLTSAASADTTVAAAVAQVDDESTPEAATPGVDRLRARLDDLVVDGTITADQADAVAAHLAEQAGDRIRDRRDRREDRADALSALLGVDTETLRTELRGGATLAELAEANGVSVDELVDVLVADAMERIDAAVESGRIDQATADEKAAELEARITERVTTPRGER